MNDEITLGQLVQSLGPRTRLHIRINHVPKSVPDFRKKIEGTFGIAVWMDCFEIEEFDSNGNPCGDTVRRILNHYADCPCRKLTAHMFGTVQGLKASVDFADIKLAYIKEKAFNNKKG